ncbi:hypothetical protein KI387_040792 [Taxus chinensis]|uniref:Cytochrome P450 n=1 Tax=Taxus chinensis TaxID=29808 RepID=A0AA38CD25_TAXCH|nr:hypothetical protein KI387_040792 [Taxus chinensis]
MDSPTLNILVKAPATGLALFLACVFILYKIVKKRPGEHGTLPPGPRPWPLLGNLHQLGDLPHQSLAALAKKYGPVMFLRLGSIPTVVVSSPAMAKEFLKTHDRLFADRPTVSARIYLAYDGKDVAYASYGDYWRQMKKLCTLELLTRNSIVKETFRLHAPGPLLVPHQSTQSCNVGGYHIPTRTRLFVNIWAIGRDESIWDDPYHFKPERFIGKNIDFRGQHYELLPFGTARRGCPGIPMGLLVTELTLAQLIHCFHWTVEGEVNMHEMYGLTVPGKFPISARPSWRLTSKFPG